MWLFVISKCSKSRFEIQHFHAFASAGWSCGFDNKDRRRRYVFLLQCTAKKYLSSIDQNSDLFSFYIERIYQTNLGLRESISIFNLTALRIRAWTKGGISRMHEPLHRCRVAGAILLVPCITASAIDVAYFHSMATLVSYYFQFLFFVT